MTKLDDGLEMLSKVDGAAGLRVGEALADIAPDVTDLMLEFVFGDIYKRPGLDLKQRETVTLASLLTQGDTAGQLEVHIHAALNVGLTQKEIVEIFIQCIPYTGFPRVLNAIYVAKKIFAEEK